MDTPIKQHGSTKTVSEIQMPKLRQTTKDEMTTVRMSRIVQLTLFLIVIFFVDSCTLPIGPDASQEKIKSPTTENLDDRTEDTTVNIPQEYGDPNFCQTDSDCIPYTQCMNINCQNRYHEDKPLDGMCTVGAFDRIVDITIMQLSCVCISNRCVNVYNKSKICSDYCAGLVEWNKHCLIEAKECELLEKEWDSFKSKWCMNAYNVTNCDDLEEAHTDCLRPLSACELIREKWELYSRKQENDVLFLGFNFSGFCTESVCNFET